MGSWVSRISGTLFDIGYGIGVDSAGNSYVTGQYGSLATIYNSDRTAFQTMSGSGNNEAFVIKFGSTGMASWVSRISGATGDIGYGIAVDSAGNSYVTGQYTSPATIYNSDRTAFRTLSGPGSEVFVAKYNTNGMCSWVNRIGGATGDIGYGIAIDSLGNSYITGQYTSPATIYNSDGAVFQTITGSGTNDAFVVKLNDGPSTISTFNLIDLDNIEANNGKMIYIANKVYQQGTFILNLQTQSLVTYLTINVNTSISLVFFNGSWIVLSQI
jgi:hypothetical protein